MGFVIPLGGAEGEAIEAGINAESAATSPFEQPLIWVTFQ